MFRNSIIHKIHSEFLQPFWYIGIQYKSPRSNSWSSFLFGFGFLVGLVNRSLHSFLSTCLLDTSAGWESIPHKSSRALVSLSLDTVEDVMVGEVDELEEDVGQA